MLPALKPGDHLGEQLKTMKISSRQADDQSPQSKLRLQSMWSRNSAIAQC
jgi:hypothetical protein